jgi:rhamnose transport system permease protein
MISHLLSRRETPIAIALVVLVMLVSLIQPRFLSTSNIQSILLWMPLITIVALGEMAVILTRGIDVSVGSSLGLSGMLVGMLLRDHPEMNVYLAAVIGIGIGAVLGAINGGLIAKADVPPIVATLGTLGVYRGLTFIVSNGKQVDDYQLPRALAGWSMDGPFGQSVAPWVVFVALGAAAFMGFFLTRSRTGRDLYAIGGNPEAAIQRGVSVRLVTFGAYVLCGAGAGLAGVLYASRFGTVNPASIGNGFELLVIAATVIGGTSIFGGVGSVTGVVLGCLLLGTINVALAVLNIADTWQSAVYGAVILLAVLFDDAAMKRLRRKVTGE